MTYKKWYLDNVSFDECIDLGLMPDIGTGDFVKPDALLAFVLHRPEYRIISSTFDVKYNRYVPGCKFYNLSRNQDDPSLCKEIGDLTPERLQEIIADIYKKSDGNPSKEERMLISFLKILVCGDHIDDHFTTMEQRRAVRTEMQRRRKTRLPA